MEKKILIVDDSEMNLFLLQSIFYGDDTIQTILESDSTKVLGHLRENIPDLILLDLMMPRLDGFQLLHEIRADPGFSGIPVIVISARHDQEAIEQVMDYGVEAYLKKPVNLKETEKTIRDVLARKHVDHYAG